jgi:hypothetical protein
MKQRIFAPYKNARVADLIVADFLGKLVSEMPIFILKHIYFWYLGVYFSINRC